MNKYFRHFVISAMVFIMILTSGILASADSFVCTIDSVRINTQKNTLTINAAFDAEFVKVNRDRDVFVFELMPGERELGELSPRGTLKAENNFKMELAFSKQMIYSSFVIAIKNEDGTFTRISDEKYIENISDIAENTADYPHRSTKKGLCAQIGSDAQYLGSAHTIISVEIEDYISPVQRENTISHTLYGQTFYFYEDKLALLDHRVKAMTEAGMNVYFNIVLGKSENSELDFLYLDRENTSASLFAINTITVKSARLFIAFCEYMAERYSGENAANGFVPAYILGYEINARGTWNNIGEVSFEEYVNYYESAFRILHSAVKSKYANARVFVSVSNVFNSSEYSTDYGARDLLSAFAGKIQSRGEIDWALAINPYPSDPSNTQFWEDELAIDSIDTKYLTMKNLDVLTDYMSQGELTYDTEVRDIIISEFGINGNIDDAKNSDCQAGAYALAYAIAEQNPYIDAFIYYRHVDHPAEPVQLGLWSSNALSPLVPESKKPIYDIFRNADTSNNALGLDMARAFSGNDIFNKYAGDYKSESKKSITEAVSMLKADIPPAYSENTLFDLTSGEMYGFYPSDSSSFVELRPVNENEYTTMLYSSQKPAFAKAYMGISCSLEDVSLEKAEYISIKFKPVTPNDETLTVMLRLDNYDIPAYSFEGVAQITSNSTAELTFKISDFVKLTDGRADTVKLLYKPGSDSVVSGEYGLWLESVSIHNRTGLSTLLSIIFTIIVILVVAAVAVLLIFINVNKTAKNKIKAIVGKTRSRIIGFLKDKKIISRRHKKKKGAKMPQSKSETGSARPLTKNTFQDTGVRIVNGRVMPQKRTQHVQSIKKTETNGDKDDK